MGNELAVSGGSALSGSELQVVTFNLGKEEFAVPILQIQEINRLVEITRVPKSPNFVEGVINLRGKVIPVLDLRKRFGLQESELGKFARIVVVNMDGRMIGLIVDSVSEVLRLSDSAIEPAPPIVAGIDAEYIRGLGKIDGRLLILLDLSKILTQDEHRELVSVA